MLNPNTQHNDLPHLRTPESYGMTTNRLAKPQNSGKPGLFCSEIPQKHRWSLELNNVSDFTQLINDEIKREAYVSFLKTMAEPPIVIMEEKSPQEVRRDAKLHPKKRFSMPVDLYKCLVVSRVDNKADGGKEAMRSRSTSTIS